jgi:hypothetical protein
MYTILFVKDNYGGGWVLVAVKIEVTPMPCFNNHKLK